MIINKMTQKTSKRKSDWEQSGAPEINEYEEKRELLHEITQDTRFDLIQTILMHPDQLPSLNEVEYMHPDRSKATLREHLEKLCSLGIVDKLKLPKERQTRDSPKVFYGISDQGRDILSEFGLLDVENTLQYLYENMEKSDKIKRYEDAPRPSRD
ncbi:MULTISPECIES: transcriptional regulator [Halorubrum]|nr:MULTISPECIES: transcriptional regulator [Halorubrum]